MIPLKMFRVHDQKQIVILRILAFQRRVHSNHNLSLLMSLIVLFLGDLKIRVLIIILVVAIDA